MNRNSNSKEKILAAASKIAQAHGYGGLNFRDLADQVGIKAASIYHHFPSKGDLATEVARRYWQDSAAVLDKLLNESADPIWCLNQYPATFRTALENDNRLCLCSFMAAEFDDLPESVKTEIQTFADVNVAWLNKVLLATGIINANDNNQRARAIFAGIAGAQLIARSRADIAVYDAIIDGYRESGLLPA